MDEVSKLKIKLGDHLFEAEGTTESVREQFAAFKDMVSAISTQSPTTSIAATPSETSQTTAQETLDLSKIMSVKGRVVALTAHQNDVKSSVLLILLGQRNLRQNESVSGSEIMDGLRESGHAITRVDFTLDKLSNSGSVIKTGENRSRRYRLNFKGIKEAQDAARDLIASVAAS